MISNSGILRVKVPNAVTQQICLITVLDFILMTVMQADVHTPQRFPASLPTEKKNKVKK